MISALCCTISVPSVVSFNVMIGVDDEDPISQAIIDENYVFPWAHHLLFSMIRQGDKILDLGAHIGTFSLAAAALGCDVISVEASPHNVALLEASVTQNGFERIQVVSSAVSDHAGTLKFIENGPYGIVSSSTVGLSTLEVPAITVDELIEEIGWGHVDFIKMDVEGSEVAAIQGMSRLLVRADAPTIVYESNGHTLQLFGETPNHLIAALERFGYQNYLVEPGRLVPVQSSDLQAECVVDYLACKHQPDSLQDWRVEAPMTLEGTVARVLSSCSHPSEFHRAYIAHSLAGAGHSVLSNRKVGSALDSLSNDTNADVRSAVTWWKKSPWYRNELRRFLDDNLGRIFQKQ
jgi:FkbM family methyltransferase